MEDSVHDLLIGVCRRDASRGVGPAELGRLADPLAWRQLLEQAQLHGVMGLTVETLARQVFRPALPGTVKDEVDGLVTRGRRRAALWVAERSRVLGVLRRRGLDPVMLKGGALCTALYANPAEREFGDLDLLVPEAQLTDALEALLNAGYQNPWNRAQLDGYRTRHFNVPLTHPQGFVVEVHWGLTAAHLPFQLDPAEFLAQSVVAEASRGAWLRLPRPEHLILHVVSQSTADGFDRLVKLVDLDRIIGTEPRLDWSLLVDAALRGELTNPLAVSLQLARRLLGTEVPPEVLARIGPRALERLHLNILKPVPSLLTRRFPQRASAGHLLLIWLMRDARQRARYLRRVVTGRDDPLRWLWDRQASPDVPAWTFGSTVITAAKLAGYQAGLYLAGAASAATCRGRAQLRFWSS